MQPSSGSSRSYDRIRCECPGLPRLLNKCVQFARWHSRLVARWNFMRYGHPLQLHYNCNAMLGRFPCSHWCIALLMLLWPEITRYSGRDRSPRFNIGFQDYLRIAAARNDAARMYDRFELATEQRSADALQGACRYVTPFFSFLFSFFFFFLLLSSLEFLEIRRKFSLSFAFALALVLAVERKKESSTRCPRPRKTRDTTRGCSRHKRVIVETDDAINYFSKESRLCNENYIGQVAYEAAAAEPATELCEHASQAALWSRDVDVSLLCIAQPCEHDARRHDPMREYWDICMLDLRTPLRSLNQGGRGLGSASGRN